MTRLVCPFCGERELREFVFRKTVPQQGASAFERVYLRVEDPALSVEHWQHVQGCRAWLLVERNPTSGAVLSVRMLAGSQP